MAVGKNKVSRNSNVMAFKGPVATFYQVRGPVSENTVIFVPPLALLEGFMEENSKIFVPQ